MEQRSVVLFRLLVLTDKATYPTEFLSGREIFSFGVIMSDDTGGIGDKLIELP